MKNKNKFKIIILSAMVLLLLAVAGSVKAEAIVVDHNDVNLSAISESVISEVKEQIKIYYAHASYGEQIAVGLQSLEDINSEFNISIDSVLWNEPNALNILEDNGIDSDGYWRSEVGRQAVQNIISQNSEMNVIMWSWDSELNSYTQEQIQEYLDAMASLEEANPNIVFVYMTGNAQASGIEGYNRYVRNNQIRNWVKNNSNKNRVLFDFADLDSWKLNSSQQWEQATEQFWNGSEYIEIPIEHPDFKSDLVAHTTYESCEQKGSAIWSMLQDILNQDNLSEEVESVEEGEIVETTDEDSLDAEDIEDTEGIEELENKTLYYGENCAHCGIIKKYIEDNSIEIAMKEVYQYEENLDGLKQKAGICNISLDEIGVPFLWTEEGCLMGDKIILDYFATGELGESSKEYDDSTMSVAEIKDIVDVGEEKEEEKKLSSFMEFLKNGNEDKPSTLEEEKEEIQPNDEVQEEFTKQGLTDWIKDAKMMAIVIIGAIVIIATVGYTIKEMTN